MYILLIFGPRALSILFNEMLVHGYTPDILLHSSIISIPKDSKGNLSSSDNYRGISLFNSICKLFDMVILDLFKKEFSTSDMQFGFKNHHSTIMCTAIYLEAIHHFVNNNSDVYSCLLDASKAFDRVHYGKLFDLLISKNVPFCIIRLIKDSYLRQNVCVVWDNYRSPPFSISNGVKQGGVLSPVLFTMYIDVLLIRLKETGIGCIYNGVYVGAVAYADDVTLICPSIRGLNAMLSICLEFSKEFDILFNAKKTMCIKFGADVCDVEHTVFNGVNIIWQDKVRHLGNIIKSSLNDDDDCTLKASMFIGSVNKLLSNFGMIPPRVLCKTFNSYCCSMYGSQLWRFNSKCFNQLCIYWNKAVRRIFNLPYCTHTWLLGPLMNQLHVCQQLYIRSLRFLNTMFQCPNEIVNMCVKSASLNASTPIGYKFAFYRHMYGMNVNSQNVNTCINRIRHRSKLDDDELSTVNNLDTLIEVKVIYMYIDGLDYDDIKDMIDISYVRLCHSII